MCDHTSLGRRRDAAASNSPRVKLLFDIYHVQIMEGDIVPHHPR
jgi:hydroxypyruvate isomerase